MTGTSLKPLVAILDPYHPDATAKLEANNEIDSLVVSKSNRQEIYDRAQAIMVRSDTAISPVELSKFSQLKYVVKQGVGVDNIDLEAAKQAGIEVYNTPGLNAEAVAELALSLALCLARRITEIDRSIREGKAVVRSQTLGRSLFGKTLGVIGMGNIGIVLAKKWIGAMEGTVVGYDPHYQGDSWSEILGAHRFRQVDQLNNLLQVADVVSLHVPLTDSTKGLIARDEFTQMKQDAILLNCARGGIVDEEALLEALESNKLVGAGLDAMEIEPPTREAYGSLLKHPNVIITPHIGASTREIQSLSGVFVADLVVDLVMGRRGGNRVA
ncbi:hypothetical protein LTR84_003783 [Exophiala bonariae]|uniref:Phosphoglycerate dehydrogenase n=1 Tax=Exophiala bonariae TaxID=1690606 RepID=A0AAV9N6A5_9EURO|nr:hypothetical protein LTR84_003783 [Exophiala bonariae]